ncbi:MULTISPECIES: SusC/RagA family TonB-linked outer membrane protein [Niastella]|uniref:TonB-dependent receptor n=1 Tax=Niastella soli TaxID=2821487 RepID=A0ABS3Z1K9_9BACT|nr:TonB-dependent receptor [Niastella soli]MBO9204035.1 TonB-dependent receptor [Niastella soli]
MKCLIMAFFMLLNGTFLFAQERVVTGKIKDPSGNPLPGVNVNVSGTRISVTADVTGTFRIPVSSENSVLVFTFVGFLQKEQKVGSDNEITVSMTYDNADLDQVVVVGYGTSKRRDLTGAVYTIKPNQVTAVPAANPMESLQGKIPGLDISRSGGQAGAGMNIQLRGNRTLAGNDKGLTGSQTSPLFIIDGFQTGNIADINPNDIESVEVLKDASATAIYGWMGANGVIIVTTKKGKDRPKVSYNGYYGVNGYADYPKSRIGDDYIKLRREAWRTTGDWNSEADDAKIFTASELDAIKNNQWVDWQDLLVRNGHEQSHSASIQSGGDKTKVFFSTGYYKEEGMLRGNDYTRFNTRLNFDQKISNIFKAGFLTQFTWSKQNSRPDPLNYATTNIDPLGKPYNDDGSINWVPLAGFPNVKNPLGDEAPGAYVNSTIKGALTVNGYLEVTPMTGLTFRSNLGTNLVFDRAGLYWDSLSYTNYAKGNKAQQTTDFNRFYNWDNILTYNKKIGEHNVTLTALTSFTRTDNEQMRAGGFRQALSSFQFYNLGALEAANRDLYSSYTKGTTMSYAGRLNYTLMGKYLLTASIRADGVSRLSPGNKWDYFPSAGIGWNIHQEDFMKDFYFVNNLKLRATYGVAGNAGGSAYYTQALVNTNAQGAYGQNFGDIPAYGFYFSGTAGNPNLAWEKTSTGNIGLDFAFLKSRLYGSIDAYKARTTDVIMRRGLPTSTGLTDIFQNVGETENKGIEVVLSSLNTKSGDFKWTTTATFTAASEKIVDLVDGKDIVGSETSTLMIGHPVKSFYSYKKLGIWQTDEKDAAAVVKWQGATPFAPGDIKVEDIDHNDSITTKDQHFVGTEIPKWYAGLQNTFSYKGLELSVYVYARWGQTINATYMAKYNPQGTANGPASYSYWTPENPTNDFPRPNRNKNISGYNGYQSLNFIDGSFVKLKTVTLAYTLPSMMSKRFFMDRFRIYATGNNLLTKSKSHLLKGYDPERNGQEDNPLTRQFVIGVNADF